MSVSGGPGFSIPDTDERLLHRFGLYLPNALARDAQQFTSLLNLSIGPQYKPAAQASEPSRRDLPASRHPRRWNGVHSLALRAWCEPQVLLAQSQTVRFYQKG